MNHQKIAPPPSNMVSDWLNLIILIAVFLMPAIGRTQEANACAFIRKLERFSSLTEKERKDLVRTNYSNLTQLSEVLTAKFGAGDENEKSYAAYFLGEYRFPQAVNLLAKNISWEDKIRSNTERGSEWFWDRFPATQALVKIGNPAIPAVIRNLAESDDATFRRLSLSALYHIEGDKDIVQLRLQKALAAEKVSTKQVRLQSALKDLAGTSFGN